LGINCSSIKLLGSYNPNYGSTSSTACQQSLPGLFIFHIINLKITFISKGFYVNSYGASRPTACEAG
jgi:hypothetical protein